MLNTCGYERNWYPNVVMSTNQYLGKLLLLVSVPGGGKGTLLEYLKSKHPEFHYAVSCTSRPQRPGEIDGENYHFLTPEEFQRRIETGEFLEWIQQDGGRYYGTLKSEISDQLAVGKVVVREVEVRGVRSIRSLLPEDIVKVIFVTPGSWEEMRERILARAPIDEIELAHRQERYESEMKFAPEADYIIENKNGELEIAQAKLEKIIEDITR